MSEVTEVWVWVSEDPDTGDESIVGYTPNTVSIPLPLLAFGPDDDAVSSVVELGRKIHSSKPRAPRMRLVKFTNAQEIEVLDHARV